jgi:predicted small secreted protein
MEEKIMRKTVAKAFLAVFLFAGAATALSACNTTAGAGKDMSAAGKAITNEANKDK